MNVSQSRFFSKACESLDSDRQYHPIDTASLRLGGELKSLYCPKTGTLMTDAMNLSDCNHKISRSALRQFPNPIGTCPVCHKRVSRVNKDPVITAMAERAAALGAVQKISLQEDGKGIKGLRFAGSDSKYMVWTVSSETYNFSFDGSKSNPALKCEFVTNLGNDSYEFAFYDDNLKKKFLSKMLHLGFLDPVRCNEIKNYSKIYFDKHSGYEVLRWLIATVEVELDRQGNIQEKLLKEYKAFGIKFKVTRCFDE